MLFVKNQVKPRKAGGNLRVGDSDRMEFTEEDSQPTEACDEPDEEASIPDVTDDVHETTFPQQRNAKRGAQQQLIAIEARKLKLLESKVRKANVGDDEDDAFFKSLLPHVRKLKPEEKMNFRMAVQQLVQEHVYNKNQFLNNPNQANQQQLSTPTRDAAAASFIELEHTPLSFGSVQNSPTIPHQTVTIQYQNNPHSSTPERPTNIVSTRQYYSVITSPISSVTSHQ